MSLTEIPAGYSREQLFMDYDVMVGRACTRMSEDQGEMRSDITVLSLKVESERKWSVKIMSKEHKIFMEWLTPEQLKERAKTLSSWKKLYESASLAADVLRYHPVIERRMTRPKPNSF